ncbi:MAG: phenylalanine--tRNA ligase subunit beta [Clostridiales bacterium]|nr:phenylalanine--tRNA ligase subunit beta [Clostridiales bacterium]
MLVPVSWLKDYVDIDIDIERLAEAMTMSGTMVESILESGREMEKVVVGKVIEIRPHPNADKLVLGMVDVGDRVLQLVTGAKNVKAGDLIPVALDGAVLPGGVEIRAGKIRGEDSEGMMCSALELALDLNSLPEEKKEGIYILEGDYAPGTDIRKVLTLNEKVLDLDITTNRPDCLSMIGVAREVGAVLGVPYRMPEMTIRNTKGDIRDYLKGITIQEPDMCFRYLGRVIDNVNIEPSPQWMQKRLIQAGMRPINNIVDITNYVMLELGQPLHAFDLEKVGGREIIVRRAKDGERIVTLDGKERTLDQNDLVIADTEVPVGIAGVMGGEYSEVTSNTRTILLESASFNGYNVRHTCKKLGLWSEASFRFVRGVCNDLARIASDRVAMLMEELGAGQVVGDVINVYPNPLRPHYLEVSAGRINRLLGVEIPARRMRDMLERLEMKVEEEKGDLRITVPTFRQDLRLDYDIAEEVARLYGYNNIPKTVMSGSWVLGTKSRKEKVTEIVREVLCGCGLYEIYTYSFESPAVFDRIKLPEKHPIRKAVTIQNPLGEEYSIMRTTLLPAMLNVISLNYNRGAEEAGFYEMAPRFLPREIPLHNELPEERLTIALGLYGNEDYYSLKGKVEALLEELNITGYEFKRAKDPSYHPGRTAEILVDGEVLGIIGEMHPDVLESYDIGTRVYAGELDFVLLMEKADDNVTYTPLPRYPSVNRDMALLVDKDVPAGTIERVIREAGRDLVEDIRLFDIYTGTQIPAGKKSIAYSLTLRSLEKTLTEQEASWVLEGILEELHKQTGAIRR